MSLMIWVGTINHKHGANHYAATTEAGIWGELAGFCREWWCTNGPGEASDTEPPIDLSDQEVVERYFAFQAETGGSEDYTLDEVRLSGDLPQVATLTRITEIAISPEGTLLDVCDVLEKAGMLTPVYSLARGPRPEGST